MTARYLAAPSPSPAALKRGSMSAPSGTPNATVTGIVPGYWNRGYVSEKHATLRSAPGTATFTAESPRTRAAVPEPLQRFYSGSRYAPPSTTYSSDRALVQSVSVPAQVASAPTSLTQTPGSALGVSQRVGCSVVTQAAESCRVHTCGSSSLKTSSFPLEPVRVLGSLQGSVTITSGAAKSEGSSNRTGAGSMNAPVSPKWSCQRHGSPPPMTLQRRKSPSPPVALAVPLTTQHSQKSIRTSDLRKTTGGVQRVRSPSPIPRHVIPVGPLPVQPSSGSAKNGSPLPKHGYRHVPPTVQLTVGSKVPQVASGALVPPIQVHSSVRLENISVAPCGSGGSLSSSCRLDTMMLPGDVLSTCDHGGGRIWDIGRAGGFMGHTFVVTARPRRVSWNSRHAEEQNLEAIWPRGDVSEIWAVRIMESMRDVAGLHEAEAYVYVDGNGQLILIGETCNRAGELFFQDPELVELWQSPVELRTSFRLDLMTESLDETRAQIGDVGWSVTTAARAVLTNANIPQGAGEAEIAACWQQEPICTSVVIALWQRYLCKLAQALSASGNPVTPIDLIMRWMPLKADRGLPGELLATMQKAGWNRIGHINGQISGVGVIAHEMSPRPKLARQATPSSHVLARIASPLQTIAAQRNTVATTITAPGKPGDLGRLQGIYENLKIRTQAPAPRPVEII